MTHSTLKMILLAPALLAVESMSFAAAPTTVPASAPAMSPTTRVTSVPTTATTQPTTDEDEQTALTVSPTTQISLNFKDAPIDAVLEHLSAAAGFIVIKDAPVTGRITVFSKQPVSPAEAAEMLNSVLKVSGNTAIQMGRILKITTLDKAKKSSIPVHFGADPKKIAQTDELITQVIPVRSVDAVKLKTDLQPLVSTNADLSANGGSNSIIITDTSANIRRVVEIISSLDTRDALENTIRVKQMKYADATAAAKLVTEIFNADQNKGQTNAPSPAQFFRNMRRGGQPQPEETQGGHTGKVIAAADQRTNTIVVTGPADTLKVIDGMLDELDANPAADQAFFIYSVKNGQSQNMAVVLNNLFGAGSTSTSNNRTTANTSINSSSRGGFGGISSGGFGNSGRAGSGGFGSTGGGFGANTPINRSSNAVANVSPAIANAASQFAGQVYVVADVDTNSLLVSTASKYQKQVHDIIAELDRPVPQVLIKVLIAEVTHNNSEDLGVDFSILNTRPNGEGTKAGTSFLGTPTPSGGLVVSMVESNVTATLRALAVAGKLDVLSRPYILASDNQLATITVGKEVPIITDSRLDINNNPVNQITYRDLGIILNVTPHINPEGLVILDVSPEVSDITDQTVPISSTVNAPVFSLRSADTRVGINDGQTIVIGGLMQDQKTQQVNKVPILGDIPLIGLLFQRNQITKTKTELLIFLTPHVASAPDKLMDMSQDEMKGVKLVPNAVQPGTFKEHLEGMRRGDSATQPSPELVIPDVPDHRSAGSKDEPPLPGTR